MTTGDEEAENLVDNLFREVDDQFKDLEREYSQAREDLASADPGRPDTPSDALEASNERFELLSKVATLQAEVSRQADELDERDRLLGELGDKIDGFQADIAERDEMLQDLHAAKQEALDERREQARLSALLDARAAERQELADVAQRLQNERDHVQELLTTALARFDEAEAVRVQMDDKLRHLEAARDTAAHEHDARAHELIESRAEMSKLADQLDELTRNAAAADVRAEKAEALAERRANEAGYLNRRIEAMNDKLTEAAGTEQQVANQQRELAMSERRITELERELDTHKSEAAAAQAAVDAIAERTSDYDELVAKIGVLEEERDAAWLAASGGAPAEAPAAVPSAAPAASDEVVALADRAREMGARRSNEAELAAEAAEVAAANAAAAAEELAAAERAVAESAAADEAATASAAAAAEELAAAEQALVGAEAEAEEEELLDLDDDDVAAIESDLADYEVGEVPVPRVEVPVAAVPTDDIAPIVEPVADVSTADIPRIDAPAAVALQTPDPQAAEPNVDVPPADIPRIDAPGVTTPQTPEPEVAEPTADLPRIDAPVVADPQPPEPEAAAPADDIPKIELAADPAPAAMPAAEAPTEEAEDQATVVRLNDTAEIPAVQAPSLTAEPVAARKRAILPADLVPNTPEAVSHLLNQAGVIAIVDARSTCGRTGIRPSELFDRVAQLRDDFDLPVEVVVTPVSTPVGGAPDLPAIGVHHVTGADTVADRIRALCMGFPADQPLVVIAGDDHVRRAAIGEEANVVEPSAVLNLATE